MSSIEIVELRDDDEACVQVFWETFFDMADNQSDYEHLLLNVWSFKMYVLP